MINPTAPPWKVGLPRAGNYQIVKDGLVIAETCYMGGTEQARINAEFIVAAVNAYKEPGKGKTK